MAVQLRYLMVVLGVAVALAAGCSATTEIVAPEAGQGAGPAPGDDQGSFTAGANGELSSVDVYRTIEDSVVFVLAPDSESSGSGIVIQDRWILTNAHVVDRHRTMRIGRSDGTDLGLHPVHAVDWIFDLALVGPIDDESLKPIAQGSSGELALGSRVLLAGFPDEDSVDPTPTLTEGIVSRRRNVALGDYPFLQVDATIAPGQSGGAMVNGRGELVGISGLEFGEGEFGLVFASDPLWPRIDELLATGSPGLPDGPAEFEISGEVGPLTNFGFTVEVEEDGGLDMLVTAQTDVWVDVQTLGGITVSQIDAAADPFGGIASGENLYVDELVEGGEEIISNIPPGTYQVVIGTFAEFADSVSVSSGNAMRLFEDPEEGQELPLNQIVEGDFNWNRDTDTWLLTLEAGETVTVTADGIADTVVVIRQGDEVITNSDDEGLGLFGTGSEATFTAETAGTYSVEIGTYDQTRWGYLIEARTN